MTNLRKTFVASVASITIASMTMFAIPFSVKAAVAKDGDLIKMDGYSSVYYLANGKRYVFPNQTVYMSWYTDFSSVVTISQSELESYPLASLITMRPGTRLVKIQTNPNVYAVEPGGTLRKITSEAQATSLYGADWAKRVSDVNDAFFFSYKTGSDLATGAIPAGTLVKNSTGSDIFYFDGTNYRKISSMEALNANRFQTSYIITAPTTVAASGTEVSGAESAIMNIESNSGGNANAASGVTVALASDNASSATVPTGVSVDFLKFNLTASNDGDVTVNGIKFTAAGLGTATNIDAVTVYNNGAKLGTSKDIDSNNVASISFTNALVITKGTTVTLTVKAKIATGTGQHALSIKAASDVTTNGTAVSGSFPMSGNVMTGTSVTVGELTIANDGTLADIKLGDKAATLAKFKVTNNNVEDVTFKAIILKKDTTSTAADDDFENLKLTMDGAEVASATAISGKYVTFTLNTPATILKSQVKRFAVTGDVVDGAGKTLTLALDATSDVTSTGNYYGFQTLIVDSNAGDELAVTAGTVSVEKVNATGSYIKKDASDVEMGTFKITANSGKNVELSTLKLTITSANDAPDDATFAQIENIEVFNKTNNTTYDLAFVTGADGDDTTKVYSNTAMGLILASGVTNELVVRADTKASATNGDYTVAIASASGGDLVMKETGNDTTIADITPNSVSLKKVTILVPAVTFSTNSLSASYSAVVGTADVEILNFNVKANEASELKVTEFKFDDADAGSTITSSIVSEFKLWSVDAAGAATLMKTVSGSNLSSEEVAFSNLTSTVAANATNKYKLTATLVKDSNQDGESMRYMISGYAVEETGKGSAVYDTVADDGAGAGNPSDGIIHATDEAGSTSLKSARTVEIKGNGSLLVAMDNTDSKTNADIYQIGGSVTKELGALKMKAQNEDVKVTKIVVATTTLTTLNSSFSRIGIWDGATELAFTTSIGASSASLDNLSIVVPQSSKTYYIKGTLNNIGMNMPGAVDKNYTLVVSGVEAEGVSSGDSLTASNAGNGVGAGEIAYDTDNDASYDDAQDGVVTGASKIVTPVVTQITAVDLVSSYTGTALATSLVSGASHNAAIIKVTTNASTNTLANGDAAKTMIDKVKVDIAKGLNGSESFSATIERIGGTQGTVAAATSSVTAQFDTSSNTDFQVSNGDTAYFLVKVTPTFTGTDNSEFIQVGLGALNGTAATNNAAGANFEWRDGSDATDKFALRISGITSVDGTQIKD